MDPATASTPPTQVEAPPPRQPWEEPPEGGWSSQLSGVGLETLWLLTVGAVGVSIVRIIGYARRMAAHPETLTGTRHALVIGLWAAACLLTASILVYLWKRMGGLALLAAMLTDYGRVARLGGRPPVFVDAPPEPALRITHLSDLHVTEAPRVRVVEKPIPGGNARLPALLDHAELQASDLVIVTGDITDRGTAVSWRCFLDALEERGLAERTLLVPGNHDLSLVDAFEGARHALRADRFGIVQLANLLKFAEAFAETRGGREGFVLDDQGELTPFADAWPRVERQVRPLIAQLPTAPAPRLRLAHLGSSRAQIRAYRQPIEAARRSLVSLFPVAVPLAGHDAVVFVLNSCVTSTRHPATNAIGHVGRRQYRRLERLGGLFAQRVKLLALHHHVVRRGEERGRDFVSRLMAKFTVLGDVRPLVRFCQKHQVRAVLNGHRHLSYQLKLPNGTVLLASPSSTLGDELAQDPRPQFLRYDVQATPDPHTVGIYRRVVRPTSTATSTAPSTAPSPASGASARLR